MSKKFVIAPYAMHQSLFSLFRQNDPFQDVKIISKEDFLNSIYEQLSPIAIKEIMIIEKCEETTATSIAKVLPYLLEDKNDVKLHHLYLLKNQLKEMKLIKKDRFLSTLYQEKEVDVFGYSPLDVELNEGLNYLHCQSFFHLENRIPASPLLLQFSSAREETFFCLNRIAALLDSGVKPHDIYVYSLGEEYTYYLQEFQNDFHFSINLPCRISLYSQDFICQFLKDWNQNHDADLTFASLKKEEIPSEQLEKLHDLLNEINDERLSFEEQYRYLISLLKKTYLSFERFDPSINFISDPTIINQGHVFILGFREGDFPLSYQDNDYLSDGQKESLGLNSSLIKGKISEQLLLNFFSQENHYYFSYSETYLTKTYHPSPFAKNWKMKIESSDIPKVFYSQKYAALTYASLSDRMKFFQEKTPEYLAFNNILSIPYDNYDNQYSPVSVFNHLMPLEHSYSDIKSYYACPFQYYLFQGLKLDLFQGNFFSALGNITHHILKNINQTNFDFNQAFDDEIKHSSYSFQPKEEILLKRLKDELKVAVKAIELHQSQYMVNHSLYMEKFLRANIDALTIVKGVIDKIIVVDEHYLFLIDYKTGKETFNSRLVAYGDSLQLPTYAFLVSQSLEFQDYTLAGLYIQHLLPSSWKDTISDHDFFPSYLKLDGLSLADNDALTKIDTTLDDRKKSSFVAGISQKDGLIKENNRSVNNDEIIKYRDMALHIYQTANQKIRDNIFPIYPTILGKNNPCQNCSFHDICFVKYEQKHFIDIDETEEENSDI